MKSDLYNEDMHIMGSREKNFVRPDRAELFSSLSRFARAHRPSGKIGPTIFIHDEGRDGQDHLGPGYIFTNQCWIQLGQPPCSGLLVPWA